VLYSQLQAFVQQRGHANVPSTDPKYSQIYSWSIQQRKFWKLTLQGDTRLTNDQLQCLVQVGLGKSVQEGPTNVLTQNIDMSFNERFQQLSEFLRSMGIVMFLVPLCRNSPPGYNINEFGMIIVNTFH
jgi:hypothetical protein